ncbi:hypothetical protein HDV00_008783 [Rhizophlyctis rosea]|nr:hypothetical protein HDV00_008783 [Rhizophlyctis rosea]
MTALKSCPMPFKPTVVPLCHSMMGLPRTQSHHDTILRFLTSPRTRPTDARFRTLLHLMQTTFCPVPHLQVYVHFLCRTLEELETGLPILHELSTTFFGISAFLWKLRAKNRNMHETAPDTFTHLRTFLQSSDPFHRQMILLPATQPSPLVKLGTSFAKGDTVMHWWAMHAHHVDTDLAIKCFDLLPRELVGKGNCNGVTPLMLAAGCGGVREVRKLVDAGADVNARDAFGNGLWAYASNNDPAEEVGEVLKHVTKDNIGKSYRRLGSAPSGMEVSHPEDLQIGAFHQCIRAWRAECDDGSEHFYNVVGCQSWYLETTPQSTSDIGDVLDLMRCCKGGEFTSEWWTVLEEMEGGLEGVGQAAGEVTQLQKMLKHRVRVTCNSLLGIIDDGRFGVFGDGRVKRSWVVHTESVWRGWEYYVEGVIFAALWEGCGDQNRAKTCWLVFEWQGREC